LPPFLKDLLTIKFKKMYAIVEIAGQQFKVERGNKVYVHRLEANEGEKIEFDKIFLLDNGGKISVGNPTVEGAKVVATVISHLRGDKVIVFKKKRRKGYQKWNNHRQSLTQILVQGVLAKGDKLESELTATRVVRTQGAVKKAESAPAEIKVVAEKKAPAKKASAKKAPAKKVAKKKED
jgi:large subunit ribosomal protein L21